MKACPNCEESVADDANFCGHCGITVAPASQSGELTILGFAPTAECDHITNLGYRLERSTAPNLGPLLRACGMEPLPESPDDWSRAEYLVAKARAGGVAAAIGWNRAGDFAVLHSLAVAPTSRGGGIGAGLLASAMAQLMEEEPVSSMYLLAPGSRVQRLFESTGFTSADREELPEVVLTHPLFESTMERARPMLRNYRQGRSSLDNSAFRLVVNNTPEAMLPRGSVFFFRQNGGVVEGTYRGGPVKRGHIIGAVSGETFHFAWHQYIYEGELQTGLGTIVIEQLADGRRQLTESLSHPDDDIEDHELVLQEL